MVSLINIHNRDRCHGLMNAMHADRKRVFVDMLKWMVPHDHQHERDEFDDEHAVYLIVSDQQANHLASVRLLRTDRRHILGDLYPELCDGQPPRGPDYREITRLCLAPGIGKAGRIEARNLLARSLVEYALLTGIRAYTGVAELRWLSQILSAGWHCLPLGMPQSVGGKMLGSLIIRIDASTLGQLDQSWRCPSAPMRVVEFELPATA